MRLKLLGVLLLGLSLTFAACQQSVTPRGGNGGTGGESSDNEEPTLPEILSYEPSGDVLPPYEPISIVFDRPMMADAMMFGNSMASLPVSYTWSEDNSKLT